MKRRYAATLESIARLHPGLHWSEVESLLQNELEAERYEGAGSSVTFVIDGVKLTVDRPHPRKECGRGLVKRIHTFLRIVGRL
jgi:hypothetical protein